MKNELLLSYLFENMAYESNSLSVNKFIISGIETLENFASISNGNSYSETENQTEPLPTRLESGHIYCFAILNSTSSFS